MLLDELRARFPKLATLPADSYVVGGAIRDLLLGIEPADVDVACHEPEKCAQTIGGRVIRLGTGEHLSAWRVVDGGHVYDFAEILEHDILTDLARRDFTVNAIGVRLRDGKLLDPHDGRKDLERQCVRMIVPENFDDDPLRCLKAVRMAVRYKFELDYLTRLAIRQRAKLITRVAAERVTFELGIIFSSASFRQAVELLHVTSLDLPLFGRALDPSQFYADDVSLPGAYALLIHDAKSYAKTWRWSADLLREVATLQELLRDASPMALYDAGEAIATQLPAVLRACGRDVQLRMPDFSIRPLLTGDEIAEVTGLREGPELGGRKRALLEAQVKEKVRTREEAVAFAAAGPTPRPLR